MVREDVEQPLFFRDKVVFTYGTIQRSKEEINDLCMIQQCSENPVIYEVIQFENGPLELNSVTFLSPGEVIWLKIEEAAMVKFQSEAESALNDVDVKVFARVLLEDGGKKYVPLSLFDIHEHAFLTFVHERREDEENLTAFVDRVLIAGKIQNASYLMLRKVDASEQKTWVVNKEGAIPYLGKNVLDIPKTEIAKRATSSALNPEKSKHESRVHNLPLSHLRKYSDSAMCNTLFELREVTMSSDDEGDIQQIMDLLKKFVEEELNEDDIIELKELLAEYYSYTKFSFSEKIRLDEVIVPIMQKLLVSLKFHVEDPYYRLLDTLLRDRDLAYKLMFEMDFGRTLVNQLILAKKNKWIQKEVIFDLLINMISHGKCMRRFIKAENADKGDSLCDTLLLGALQLTKFSMNNFQQKLEDLGKRCELFLALAKAETLCESVREELISADEPQYAHLETLIHGVNEAICVVELHHAGSKNKGILRDITETRHYAVTYVVETGLPDIVASLMRAVRKHLERFPIAPLHISTIMEKPLWFIEQYLHFVDFGDCLLDMIDICDSISGMALNNVLHNGIYADSSVDYCKEKCEKMALQTILLKMCSSLIGKTSSPQIISTIYRLCSEYPSCFRALPTILTERSVLNAIFGIVNHKIGGFKSKKARKKPLENVELCQLITLLCDAVIKDDTGMLLHCMGHEFLPILGEFLGLFVKEDIMPFDSRLRPLDKLRLDLTKFYASPAMEKIAECGMIFESVDDYLKELLEGCKFTLRPDQLKQSFARLSHMNTMSLVGEHLFNGVFLSEPKEIKKMTKSFVAERLSTVYSISDECIELDDVHWKPCDLCRSRAKELGISAEKIDHYSSCHLFLVPPEPFPEHFIYGIRILSFAATMNSYDKLFEDMLRRCENMKMLLRIWIHAVASLAPDSDTVRNVEIGAFSSHIGYEWFISSEKALPVIISIVQVLYAGLHSLSCDTCFQEETEDKRKVNGAPLRYINDDMLSLLILSVNGVISNRRWYVDGGLGQLSRKCLIWLCKLMSYWYHRYQKSQGYLMNKLMSAYVSLPMMSDGVAMLISSCGPNINPNCNVTITDYKADDDDGEDAVMRRRTRVLFDGKEYAISLKEPDKLLEDSIPNAAFWRLIKRIESLKVPILAEFVCSVASKCYATNPCTLVLTSEIAHYLIVNDVELMPLLRSVADKCLKECIKVKADHSRVGSVSGKAYKLITFWTLMSKALVSNIRAEPTVLFKVNYWILEVFNKYSKGCKAMTEGCCRALFEGYTHLFRCHNKLWKSHHTYMTNDAYFNSYMTLINGAVSWICQTLNDCRAKDTEQHGDENIEETSNRLRNVEFGDDNRLESGPPMSWDSILVAFVALKHAFEIPFTALNVLYTVLSSPMERIVKIINKQIDSEIIKVTPSTELRLNSIVRQLCDALLQNTFDGTATGTLNSDSPLHLMILQSIYDVCASIHQTGTSQYAFIHSLIQGTHNSSTGTGGYKDRASDTSKEQLQQQEDIYSDIITSSKTKTRKRQKTETVGRKRKSKDHIFKVITDTLESFRINLAAEIKTCETEKRDKVALSSQVANTMVLINAFEALAKNIPDDIVDRTPPKSLPGYIFLKSTSHNGLFRYTLGDPWSTDGDSPSCTRSIISRVIGMIKCEDWCANTCMVNQAVPASLASVDKEDPGWLTSPFIFNGCKEAVEIWKAVRFFAKRKLLFADEMMLYAPMKSKKIDRTFMGDALPYIRSVSTRAPSKHVDTYESEKAVLIPGEEENMLSQANIEKAVSKLNGVITSQTWKDFDNDLVSNGLNLRSILVNPSLLKDYSARATFLNALARHMLIKELLISVGVDVR